MNILILGTEYDWEERAIESTAQEHGHNVRFLQSRDVSLCLTPNGTQLIFEENENITQLFRSSRIIFRRTRGGQEKMITLALLAQSWNIPFADSVESIYSNLNKAVFLPTISSDSIRAIPTLFWRHGTQLDLESTGIQFPVLTKPSHGRHGEGIEVFETRQDLEKFLSTTHQELLVQTFLNIEEEYRIFVVGDTALGAVKKKSAAGQHAANYSAGAEFCPVSVHTSILNGCVALCQEQGIDVGGVDVAKVGDQYYLLEINRCPQFQGFSTATGIHVAGEIIRFVEQLR